MLAQGITTVLINPDGGGPTDLAAQRTRYTKQGIGPNVGLMVPHGSVRQAVMGMSDRDPDSEQIAKMVDLVRQGMRAGAFGLSSGLYYAPGSYSKTDEVVALARMAAQFGGVYSSHIRDESDYSIGLVAAVQEVITIAEQAGLIGVVSHMKALGPASHGLSMALVERIEAARARGVQVYSDQYPYNASGTGIVGALMPRWAQVGGRDAMLRRMRGDERKKILEEVRENLVAARRRRRRCSSAATSRIPRSRAITSRSSPRKPGNRPKNTRSICCSAATPSLVSFNMSERDIELIMRQTWNMTCTDGDLVPMGQGKPHPRAYGAFVRKLRLYVKERGVVDLAVRDPLDDQSSGAGLRAQGPRAGAARCVRRPAGVRPGAGQRSRDLPGAAPALGRHGAHHRERRPGAREQQVHQRAARPRARARTPLADSHADLELGVLELPLLRLPVFEDHLEQAVLDDRAVGH